MGNLVFQAALGGQVALSGPNTASSFTVAVPAVSGTMVTTGDTGTVTSTMISGPLTPAVGGTGVNNGSNTLSLAGNVSHTGAYTQTIAATANTSVTLPTSGTLISSSTALSGAVTGTPSSSTYLRGDGTWASLSAVTTFSAGSTGLTPSTATSGAVTLAGTLGAGYGGTGLTSPGTSGNVLTSNGSAWVSSAPSSGMTYLGSLSNNTAFSIPSGYTFYHLQFVATVNSPAYPQLRFNGITSNYNYIGWSAYSASSFNGSSNSQINLAYTTIQTAWNGEIWFTVANGYLNGSSLTGTAGQNECAMISFSNTNITSLSSVTLIISSSTSFTARLYGMT